MRKEGYYWVKNAGEWQVAQFDAGFWWLSACEMTFNDDDMSEIDEKQIVRGE